MLELGQKPRRNIVKVYEEFLCTLISNLIRATPQAYSLGAFLCSHRVINKGVHEEVQHLVHN